MSTRDRLRNFCILLAFLDHMLYHALVARLWNYGGFIAKVLQNVRNPSVSDDIGESSQSDVE